MKSADRVFDILELLLHQPEGLSAHDMSKQLGIANSSMHALIQTMEERRYIRLLSSRRWVIGTKFVEFTQVLTNQSLQSSAKPMMDKLAGLFNENVHLAVLDGLHVVYVAVHETKHPLRYHVQVGEMQPAHITGVGKVLLSQFTEERIREMYKDFVFDRITDTTIVTMEALVQESKLVRQQGYAVDNGESYEGARCYAAPIYNAIGQMVASISVSIPFFRLEQDQVARIIRSVIDAGIAIGNHIHR